MIFLDEGSLSNHHFWTMIALESTLSKENSSRHTSCFEVRDLRRFLKVIFLHLISTIRARWSFIVQFSDDFLVVSILMISRILMFGSLISSSFVIKCNCSIWFFLMMVWSLFIIDLMGLFFYTKIGSIISIGDLPTTNIIELKKPTIFTFIIL